MRIASSKLPWVLAKLKKCTLQCSKLPQVLAKFKKCTLQAQNYLGFLQSSRNAHCKLEITSGSCKAQEMHNACLKLCQAIAKLKKFMFDAHMGPTHDQSSLSASLWHKNKFGSPIRPVCKIFMLTLGILACVSASHWVLVRSMLDFMDNFIKLSH
jgi:hypothetical protein